MKEIFIRDLQPDQAITTEFLVQSKELRSKRTGENYLSLNLTDKTGEIDAKMWENVDQAVLTFERDDFVKVKGTVQVFRNKPQLTLHKIRRLEDAEVDLADFFPRSRRDPDEMWQELREIVDGIKTAPLQELLSRIISDPEIAARLKLAPAAKTLHHAFLGGLLEHILSLCRLSKLVVQNYPGIDLDLLLAGVVLHDLGKIYELSYARSFSYTTEGQLLGHMILELEILHRTLAGMPEFPRPLQTLLEHLIISHHGHYEFGSPKLPMFPEALLLHYLDDMDSKIQGMQGILERDDLIEGEWTGYLPSLGRTLLKVQKYTAAKPNPDPASAKEQPAPPGTSANRPPHPASSEQPSPANHWMGQQLKEKLLSLQAEKSAPAKP